MRHRGEHVLAGLCGRCGGGRARPRVTSETNRPHSFRPARSPCRSPGGSHRGGMRRDHPASSKVAHNQGGSIICSCEVRQSGLPIAELPRTELTGLRDIGECDTGAPSRESAYGRCRRPPRCAATLCVRRGRIPATTVTLRKHMRHAFKMRPSATPWSLRPGHTTPVVILVGNSGTCLLLSAIELVYVPLP